jgi:uncharacterized protein YidB (DUF937 family)
MSLFDQLGSALSGEHAGLLGNVLDMVGKERGGGLAGLVQAFQANGLGDVVSSWIGTGPNQAISASQIQGVLGSDAVKQLAARMGISPDAMSAKLAEVLPTAIDKLTPNGKPPEDGLLAQALSALRTKVS